MVGLNPSNFPILDTLASVIGHPDHLSLVAIAENETKARAKYNLLCRMVQPCGPPPEKSPLEDA